MIRTFKKIEHEDVVVGKLAQAVGNQVTTRFPLLEKGINLKPAIVNEYEVGGATLGKIGDKIVSVVENTIYISEYEDGSFIEIKSFTLPIEKVDIKAKVISMGNDKCVITTNRRTKLSCYLLSVSEGVYTLSEPLVISDKIKVFMYDIVSLSNTRLVASYHETVAGEFVKKAATYQIIDIVAGGMKLTQTKKVHGDVKDFLLTPFITKISDNEFLGSQTLSKTTDYKRRAISVNTIFSISSTNIIGIHEEFENFGHNIGYYEKTIAPLYLEDNKVMITTFNDSWQPILIIKGINKGLSDGVYDITDIKTIDTGLFFQECSHNIDLLRINEDGSRDYIAFNGLIINIDSSNNNIVIKDSFTPFETRDLEYANADAFQVINLGDNLLLTLNDDSDFLLYSYYDRDGKVIGVVEGVSGNECGIAITGLVSVVEAVLSHDENVYYNDMGELSNNAENGSYIGCSVSSDKVILRPDMIRTPKIVTDSGIGYEHNDKKYYHGFIPYIDETITNGQVYYLDDAGKLTTTVSDIRIGMGVSKGLYVKRCDLKRQIEEDKVDLATISKVLSDISFSKTDVSEDIIIPVINERDVVVTWTSDSEYISDTGVVTRPAFELGNQTVTLTAKVEKGTQVATKDFVFTVIKLDEVVVYTVDIKLSAPVLDTQIIADIAVMRNDIRVFDQPFTAKLTGVGGVAQTIAEIDKVEGSEVTIKRISGETEWVVLNVELVNYPDVKRSWQFGTS